MKLRSLFYIVAGSLLALVLVAAGIFFWFPGQTSLRLLQEGEQVDPTAAVFVPKQAPVMISLLTNPSRIEALSQVLVRRSQRQVAEAEIDQLKQRLLTTTGLDYAEDIEPWLGDEITLAVTTPDLDHDADNGQQPGYLLAIATQDPEQSQKFLQLFWQQRALAGTELTFEQYAGVKLIYNHPDAAPIKSPNSTQTANEPVSTAGLAPGVTSAAVGDRFILFANHPKVIRAAINNVQAPELNLESAIAYQNALQNLSTKRIGLTFFNLPQLAQWLETIAPDQTQALGISQSTPKVFESLVMSVELNRQGLVADTALLTIPGQMLAPADPALTRVKALKYIPAESPLVATGADLNQLWHHAATEFTGYEAIAQPWVQPLQTLEERWQIQIPDDVFSWVQGDYALGLLPKANAAPDWVFVAQKLTDANADPQINKLDTSAQNQGLTTAPLRVGQQEVMTWTRLSTDVGTADNQPQELTLQAQLAGLHTTVENHEIFATSIAAMNAALNAPQQSRKAADDLQLAIEQLSNPNDGYLYIDWLAIQALAEKQLPLLKPLESAGDLLFRHLKSLTFSSYGNNEQARFGKLFIHLTDS
ncbi:MAG: DUF3352 domain-containing protein [Cyanothece sp. SIO1E1]|nr:DUF3352 domain-containing protein [Cyanothece sp. SIO1E1]